jgi:signal transduction histidine kinase
MPRIKWIYLVISLLGLAIYLWGFYGQMNLASLPEGYLLAPEAFPVTVEGVDAGSFEQVRFLAEGFAPGDVIRITNHQGITGRVALVAAHSPMHLIVTFICGVFIWLLTLLVFAPRAPDGAVRDFFWCTLLFGLVIMIGGTYFPGRDSWHAVVRGMIQVAAIAALGPLFVHLSLNFPRRGQLAESFRIVPPVLWMMAATLVAWQAAAFLRYFYTPNSLTGQALVIPRAIGDAAVVSQAGLALMFMFLGRRELELTRERGQVKWLLLGLSVGLAPYVFLRVLPRLMGWTPLISTEMERLLELAIPISFVLAVVRYRFLEIDIIIRRGLIYTLLAGFCVVAFLVPGIWIGGKVSLWRILPPWLPLIIAGLAAGLLWYPLRRRIGDWVDRVFFKISYDNRQALEQLSERIDSMVDQEALLDFLFEWINDRLCSRRLVVLISRDGGYHWHRDSAEELSSHDVAGYLDLPAGKTGNTIGLPDSTSMPEIETEDFPAAIGKAGFCLVEPLQRGDYCMGMILLGPRSTGRRFVEADLALLHSCAALAAQAMERILLIQTANEASQARHRLAELNQLKSEFLSHVAHDLRTPLTSISWSVDNMLDGITGELSSEQTEYLRSMKTAASHLNKLVGNLLEISRLEQNRVQMDLAPIRLGAVLSDAVSTMKPLAEEKHITIRQREDLAGDPEAGPPKILADSSKLMEVLVNLIDNAIKYAPAGTSIELASWATGYGFQAISVRDFGPGFEHEQVADLFTRFYQGHPSPHSQRHGFGLGLYVVKSYIESMGGRVNAANDPAGGAIVTCTLPEAGTLDKELL